MPDVTHPRRCSTTVPVSRGTPPEVRGAGSARSPFRLAALLLALVPLACQSLESSAPAPSPPPSEERLIDAEDAAETAEDQQGNGGEAHDTGNGVIRSGDCLDVEGRVVGCGDASPHVQRVVTVADGGQLGDGHDADELHRRAQSLCPSVPVQTYATTHDAASWAAGDTRVYCVVRTWQGLLLEHGSDAEGACLFEDADGVMVDVDCRGRFDHVVLAAESYPADPYPGDVAMIVHGVRLCQPHGQAEHPAIWTLKTNEHVWEHGIRGALCLERTNLPYEEIMALTIADVPNYWNAQFAASGFGLGEVQMVASTDTEPFDCGAGPILAGAFFCPPELVPTAPNGVIVWSESWMRDLHHRIGDIAPAAVLAHEWGHAISYQLGYWDLLPGDHDPEGQSRWSQLEEYQADCLAGAYFGWVDEELSPRLRLSPGDQTKAAGLMFEIGDAFDGATHGSPAQRIRNFDVGFQNGPSGCAQFFESF